MTTVEPVSAWRVDGMPADQYLAHPSLSSSAARALLDSPARYRYERDHPKAPTREMLIGTAVHTRVLDVGASCDVTQFEDWRTKAAKEEVAALQASSDIVLKPSEYALVRGMADAIHNHPEAGRLLAEGAGVPERALFWRDSATGVDCRAMLDFTLHSGRAIVDLKTTTNADPAKLGRHIDNYGYHVQAGWYLDGGAALGVVDPDALFVWVFVEREPPHLITVATLDPADLAYGRERGAIARQRYRDCAEVDVWPGYPDHIITVSLPPWSRRSHDIEETPEW